MAKTDRTRKPKESPPNTTTTTPKAAQTPPLPGMTAGDDVTITALDLAAAPLSPGMEAYFKKCEEKLGFVPNVLKAYAFDMPKLEAFIAMYNDLMLAPSGLSKLEREMIAVAVSSQNRCYYCLVAHGAAVRRWLAETDQPGSLRLRPRRRAGAGRSAAARRARRRACVGSPRG